MGIQIHFAKALPWQLSLPGKDVFYCLVVRGLCGAQIHTRGLHLVGLSLSLSIPNVEARANVRRWAA